MPSVDRHGHKMEPTNNGNIHHSFAVLLVCCYIHIYDIHYTICATSSASMFSSNPALIDMHLGEGCTEEYSAAVEQSQLGGGSVCVFVFCLRF